MCDLTVCQKSIYLAEQGGRSRPGLKNWVSGRLSPSALSQLGMRVLHHPTRSVTPAGQPGGKSNGVSCSPTSTFLVAQAGLLWFHLTHQLHMNKEEAPRWLLMIKAIMAADNKKEYSVFRALESYFKNKIYVQISDFGSSQTGMLQYCHFINIDKKDTAKRFALGLLFDFLSFNLFSNKKTLPVVCITFILIRDCGHRKTTTCILI